MMYHDDVDVVDDDEDCDDEHMMMAHHETSPRPDKNFYHAAMMPGADGNVAAQKQ